MVFSLTSDHFFMKELSTNCKILMQCSDGACIGLRLSALKLCFRPVLGI